MTGGSFTSNRTGQDVRNQRCFRTGYLDQIVCLKTNKAKRRWVVLQGDTKTGLFQLNIFKNADEKVLKNAYTLNRDTFMGTERGVMQRQHKFRRSLIEYWAIMLAADTILFQEAKSTSRDPSVKKMASTDLMSWYTSVKSHFYSESWMVYPVKGIMTPEFQMALHVTHYALCLATLSPPRCFKYWKLGRIVDYAARDEIFGFNIDSSGSDAGYCEMKAESKKKAQEMSCTVTTIIGRDSLKSTLPELPSSVAPPVIVTRPDLRSTDRYSASPALPTRTHIPSNPTPNTRQAKSDTVDGRSPYYRALLHEPEIQHDRDVADQEETHVDMVTLMTQPIRNEFECLRTKPPKY